MPYIIGVDIGTTYTKAVATTASGEVLYEEKANYPTLQPFPGYSEQDPDQIFDAVISVLSRVVAKIEDKENLAAICFSAAMHSIMAISKDGRPLTHLYTWADTRSIKYAETLKNTEAGKRIYLQTGTAIHPMSPLCKIAWIKNELPEIFLNTYKFISGKEYVFYRLFGRYLIDYSVASATGLFNIESLNWNHESLAFAGINETYLSQPFSTSHYEDKLTEKFSNKIGLGRPVPFYLGASDGCLAIIGSGSTLPDEAALTIGTSGAVRKMTDHPLHDPQGRLFNYILDDKMYISGGASNNGGIVLKWFAENMLDRSFSSADAFSWFMQTAALSPAGSKGLIFLPYIYGERSPVWDANARGVFMGVSSYHRKEHFMRAILEGISFSLYQIVKAMEDTGTPINTIYASGGFIQSDLWLQMMADILNKKVIVSHAADASAMGAIFIAMHALGLIKEWHEVKAMVVTSSIFEPNPVAHQEYNVNFKVFQTLYTKLKDDFSILAKKEEVVEIL